MHIYAIYKREKWKLGEGAKSFAIEYYDKI